MALVTEQGIQQSTAGATISESSGRASLYMTSLSAVLVSLGFASASPDAFAPFAAVALPAVFFLGGFTISRLVDTSIANIIALERVSAIRSYYATLAPDAAQYFPTAGQRAGTATQEVGLTRTRFSLLYTTTTMIGTVNAILGGSAVTLLLVLATGLPIVVAAIPGFLVAAGLFLFAIAYQRRRFRAAFPDA